MSNKFVCADLHFSHKNIITFNDANDKPIRPFTTIEEHDETLVKNWNNVVKPGDMVYVLGDICFNKKVLPILSRLNGIKNSTLIMGNHDEFNASRYLEYFKDVKSCYQFKMSPIHGIMTHIPVHTNQMDRFVYNIHGHSHSEVVKTENGEIDSRYFCVSMEQINFTPLSFDALFDKLKWRTSNVNNI